jgi:plastocyanin
MSMISLRLASFTFTPQRVTVKAGATVAWINDDDVFFGGHW